MYHGIPQGTIPHRAAGSMQAEAIPISVRIGGSLLSRQQKEEQSDSICMMPYPLL